MSRGLSIKVGADISGLKKGLQEGAERVRGFGDSIGPTVARLGKLATAAAAAATAIGGVMVRQSLKNIDALGKMSDQIGIQTDKLIGLRHAAAETAGVNDKQLDMSLRRMTRRIEEAADGSGAAATQLQKLGLSAQELAKLTPDQQFMRIADAMQNVETQGEKLRATFSLFDTEGVALVSTLSQGSEAIQQLADDAERMGLSLSRVDAQQVENANTAMSNVWKTIRSVADRVAVRLAPIIEAIAQRFVSLAKETGGFQSALDTAFRFAVTGAGWMANAFQGVRLSIDSLIAVAQTLRFAFAGAFKLIVDGAAAVNDAVLRAVNATIRAMNNIPGVNVSEVALMGESEFVAKVHDMAVEAEAAMIGAWGRVADRIAAPLPSEAFKEFLSEVQEASRAAAEEAVKARGALTGVGGDESGVDDKHREEIAKRLEALRVSNLDEIEAEREKYAGILETLNLAFSEQLITEQHWHAELEAESDRHNARLTGIEQKAADARNRLAEAEAANRKRILGGALSGLTSLMNSESRKMFNIGKIAAVSQSLIATYQGMSEALKLGWPMGPVAAAAIGATGFANVAAIKAQQFGGGGGASGSVTQSINDAQAPVQQAQPERLIRIESFSPDSLVSLRDLASGIEEMAKDGRTRIVIA